MGQFVMAVCATGLSDPLPQVSNPIVKSDPRQWNFPVTLLLGGNALPPGICQTFKA